MPAFTRHSALAIVTTAALIAALGVAHAAGAFAVGACGAYGYGYDYRKLTDARAAAIRKCAARHCKIVAAMRRDCAAFAVDAKHPCGSYGWAINAHLGKAENASLRRCYQFGGRNCMVRAWACDEKG